MKSKNFLEVKGKIISSLGNYSFSVELLENKQRVLATISRHRFRNSATRAGKSKKLVEGKIVWLEISIDDFSRGRIIAFA